MDLFDGRRDAYGTDRGGCAYVEGAVPDMSSGTAKWNPEDRAPLTDSVWMQHIDGSHPIGVYPIVNDRTIWSCVDVDFDDWDLAFEIQTKLAQVGIRGWIESSRSKGWHVWIFWDKWVECKYTRSLLLWLVDDLGHPKMEVNPKAFHLAPETLGNYVRLPYPRQYLKTGRQVMHVGEKGYTLGLPQFLQLDIDGLVRTPASVVEKLAPYSPFFPKPFTFRNRGTQAPSGGHMSSGNWQTQECAVYLREKSAVIPVGRRDEMCFAIANLMHGLHLDYHKAMRMMEDIWAYQMADNSSYPLQQALEKVERRYSQ